jgi:hypothetical protein
MQYQQLPFRVAYPTDNHGIFVEGFQAKEQALHETDRLIHLTRHRLLYDVNSKKHEFLSFNRF